MSKKNVSLEDVFEKAKLKIKQDAREISQTMRDAINAYEDARNRVQGLNDYCYDAGVSDDQTDELRDLVTQELSDIMADMDNSGWSSSSLFC